MKKIIKKRGKGKMNIINVLVVVDTEGTTTSGSLNGNIYMIDTNKYCGSTGEAGSELTTVCHDTQTIQWQVVAIDPNADVEIVSFVGFKQWSPYGGGVSGSPVCNPKPLQTGSDPYWQGTVETLGVTGNTYQYSINLSIEGKTYTYDPFLNVQ